MAEATRAWTAREAVATAADANVPVFTVGLGSERRPTTSAIADVEAPLRVYPGSAFSLTGYLQAFGVAGRDREGRIVSFRGQPQGKETEAGGEARGRAAG